MMKHILFAIAVILFVLICFPNTYFMVYTHDDEEVLPAMAVLDFFEEIGEEINEPTEEEEVDEEVEEETPAAVFIPPSTEAIDELLQRYGRNMSLYYQNLETGFVYSHNADLTFFGASLNKVNHALYVYALAERGYVFMDDMHTYTAADRRGGTGRIQHMEVGTRFTTRQLLWHSIVNSCNVAYRMLINYTADMEFSYHDFVDEIGANPFFIGNISSQDTSIEDKAIWMNAVYDYIHSDSEYGHLFLSDLTETPGFFQSDYAMARKYGWANTSFHEAAVVYAPSPYILIVLTHYGDDGAAGIFSTVSRFIQQFNDSWRGENAVS